jgi:hypothetical protein
MQLMYCQIKHSDVHNFNKCPNYTHDGASVKLNTSWDENGLQCRGGGVELEIMPLNISWTTWSTLQEDNECLGLFSPLWSGDRWECIEESKFLVWVWYFLSLWFSFKIIIGRAAIACGWHLYPSMISSLSFYTPRTCIPRVSQCLSPRLNWDPPRHPFSRKRVCPSPTQWNRSHLWDGISQKT